MIDENRLWNNLSMFFGDVDFMQEIFQNARRAKAEKFSVDINEDGSQITFTYSPSIMEISDLVNLFTLSGSGWNKTVQAKESPAGWGIYSLFASADTLTIASNFGRMEINTKRWFSERKYRENWKSLIKDIPEHGKVFIVMNRSKDGHRYYNDLEKEEAPLWARFINIVEVNGKIIAPCPLGSEGGYKQRDLIFQIEPGNMLAIRSGYVFSYYHDLVCDNRTDRTTIIWYGQKCSSNYWSDHAVYNIINASVVKPILPTRKSCDAASIRLLNKKIIVVLGEYLRKELQKTKIIEDDDLYYALQSKLITQAQGKLYLNKLKVTYSRGLTEDGGADHKTYNKKDVYYTELYCPKLMTLEGRSRDVISKLSPKQIVSNDVQNVRQVKDARHASTCFLELVLSNYLIIKFKDDKPDLVLADYGYYVDEESDCIYISSVSVLSDKQSDFREYEWNRHGDGSDAYGSYDDYENNFDEQIDHAVADFTDDYSELIESVVVKRLWDIPWKSACFVMGDNKELRFNNPNFKEPNKDGTDK